MSEHEGFAPGVLKKAMEEAEGKTVPLRDRPGGEIIGEATFHNGEVHMTVTNPEMNELLMGSFPMTGLSIYSEPSALPKRKKSFWCRLGLHKWVLSEDASTELCLDCGTGGPVPAALQGVARKAKKKER